MSLILSGSDGLSDVDGTAATPAIRGTDANTGIFFPAADTIAFSEGGVEAMRINSSGQVGIGTSSPSFVLDVAKGAEALGKFENTTGTNAYVYLKDTARSYAMFSNNGAWGIYDNTAGTERMRIDSSGNLLVGTTSKSFGAVGSNQLMVKSNSADSLTVWNTGSGGAVGLWRLDTVGAGFLHIFTIGTNTVGTITTNGSTTSYNTSSDYRLKENVAPMQNALSVVQQLKPVTYTWKANGSNGQGFIAHELQEVCPDAVNGEKDAVNEDGSIKPQGIDTSFLVATLTAAIQELKATVDAQAARIAALENPPVESATNE